MQIRSTKAVLGLVKALVGQTPIIQGAVPRIKDLTVALFTKE